MKWQCSNQNCSTPCEINVNDEDGGWPTICPFGCDNCAWREVIENPVEVFEALRSLNPQNKKAL